MVAQADNWAERALEDIQKLVRAGLTKYDEAIFNGVQMHFYRKPKRFGSAKNPYIRMKSRSIGFYLFKVESSPPKPLF